MVNNVKSVLFLKRRGFYQQQWYCFSTQRHYGMALSCSCSSSLFCTVMLLYFEDFLSTSQCNLLIVYLKQQRSRVFLVLVLPLTACAWWPVMQRWCWNHRISTNVVSSIEGALWADAKARIIWTHSSLSNFVNVGHSSSSSQLAKRLNACGELYLS